MHRHFGYRGLIIQSWSSKLFDRNMSTVQPGSEIKPHEYKRDEGLNINLYQVLTDQGDIELCVCSHSIVFYL